MRTTQVLAVVCFCSTTIAPAQTTTIAATPIDRHALVTRHNIEVHTLDPNGAMAVGNGSFAFNFDVTGLQSFPEYYAKTMPIGILSDWGWHSFPNPNHYSLDTFKMTTVPKYDRQMVYPAASTSNPPPDAAYLRENENRIGLGRIGLEMTHPDGSKVLITDLTNIDERLDLWAGILTSSFEVDGTPVHVTTIAAPNRDEVATRIESPLIASGRLKLRIAFPYASNSFGPDYQDWDHPELHTTTLTRPTSNSAQFDRTIDSTHYTVRARWSTGVSLSQNAPHQFLLSSRASQIELTTWFSPKPISTDPDTVAQVASASAAHWQHYWTTGGAIDLSGNTDPRATELERRIVLSQYVMAVHDAQSFPPQETGLGVNSWYGKFHMEMYWWHAAHWALWGHPEILEKSLRNLTQLMPPGEAMAKLEGAKGVKWSKMTDPSGVESPSGVGPVLVWQQPSPIYLSELVYRAHKDRAALERYQRIVFETADYMATFVDYDPARKQYVLGPGINSADEKHTDLAHNLNPTMELAYWKWALETAQQWRIRLGLLADPHWQDVIDHIASPTVRNGIYPAMELPAETSPSSMTTFMYGVLPGRGIDKDAMRNTLHRVTRPDAPQNSVTWGTAMMAMCAARLGEPDLAVNLLAGKFDQNPFRVSGYTVRRPDQTPMYMPANGGWLSAVAMMAAGWDGTTTHAPGFPADWHVRYEGLLPMP
jgi:protein-glucosylgalactosylhydroxylysine glucosidase